MKKHSLHNLSGEQKQQLLITCDKKGNPVGTETRDICHKGDGKTHLAFMAFIFDKDNNIILAKRSGSKSLWSGFWDASVVSHVLEGETPQSAAKRRGKEEMGINVQFADKGSFYYFAKHGKSAENEYCHMLIGKTNQEVHPNPIEISETQKMKLNQLKDEIRTDPGKFTPWLLLALKTFDIAELS